MQNWTGMSVKGSNEEELYQSVVEALKNYFVGKKGGCYFLDNFERNSK
jgi:hypothetical protein